MRKQPAGRNTREQVLRVARSQPQLTAAAVALIVGCHSTTAAKHLRGAPARGGSALTRCGQATLHARSVSASRRGQGPHGCPLPESVQARLAADSDGWTRSRLVQNSFSPLPLRLMRRLAFDTEHEVRMSVARRVEHPALVAMLARDASWLTRRDAAANLSCPAQMLGVLAGDVSPDVRLAVSRRGDCPPDALVALAADTERHVRSSVAAHQSSPAAALRLLAGDPDPKVRAAVSVHRNSPSAAVERIAGDLFDSGGATRCAAARHPNCGPEALERIAGHDDDFLRAAAADNPNCGPDLVDRLAEDPSWVVRQSVAWRADLAPKLAARLAADPQRAVQLAAVRNHNCPLETLDMVSRTDVSDEVAGAASRVRMSRRVRALPPAGHTPLR